MTQSNAGKISLNKQQEEAANHVDGPVFVSAAPGSGKTRTIVERTVRLVENGISPRSILSVTFTNKAANEMKERIAKAVGEEVADGLYVSTFHALCANIQRRFGPKNLSIFDSDDQEDFMAQAARQMGFEYGKDVIKQIVWVLNDVRENLIKEDEIAEEFYEPDHAKVAMSYLSKMREKNALDFTGLLYDTVLMLENNQEVLDRLRNRWTYLQVDEFQDTNYAQLRLIELLGEHGNIFGVGDAAQSIYAFRGARYQNIQDFIDKYNAKTLSLPLNYRSTPQIVSAALNLIKHNKDLPQQYEFITENGDGDPVECFALPTPDMEGKWVAHQIQKLIETGTKPEQIAVLYRINALSRAVESGLVASHVPYTVIGGHGFYDRKEIRDAIGMLRFMSNNKDSMALARFVNRPRRQIGEGTFGKIEIFAEQNGLDLVSAMERAKEYLDSDSAINGCAEVASIFRKNPQGRNIGDVLSDLIKGLRYEEYLQHDSSTIDTAPERIENLQELVSSAAEYSENKPNADLATYLNSIALMSTGDKKADSGQVSLMSIHAAKGLEWDVVFVVGCEDSVFPHARAISEKPEEGLAEERRCAFVAFSRPRKLLICTCPAKKMKNYGKNSQFVHSKPSRFLAEAKIPITPIGA